MIPFLQSILKLSTLPFGFITSTWIMFNGWRHLSTAKWSLQSCLIAAGLVLTPCSSTAWGLLAAKERTHHSLLILLTPVIIITQNCTKKKGANGRTFSPCCCYFALSKSNDWRPNQSVSGGTECPSRKWFHVLVSTRRHKDIHANELLIGKNGSHQETASQAVCMSYYVQVSKYLTITNTLSHTSGKRAHVSVCNGVCAEMVRGERPRGRKGQPVI